MAHLGSRNKPRKSLVLFLRPVRRRAFAREFSRDMKQNSEELTDACEGNSFRRSSAAMQEHCF
ncbi:hypothetical protein D9754_02115 [Planomicrobium sp. Y74]|nr:hypothetical protein D9754_02115 [Planomicrobium sp. Y74]